MIRLTRSPEPADLRAAREKHLPRLRKVLARTGREPRSGDFKDYGLPSVRHALYEGQGPRCCYCEGDVHSSPDPVEHFRPKSRIPTHESANARPGYWWLAHCWENLLLACGPCNIRKGAKFPLKEGSIPLQPEELPPGNEEPLLLDPYDPDPALDPVLLIEFRRIAPTGGVEQWRPYPRTGDERARYTIQRVLQLDAPGHLALYREHVNTVVMPRVAQMKAVLRGPELSNGDVRPLRDELQRVVRELLAPGKRFSALSYDALRHFVPDSALEPHLRCGWPRPPVRL